MGKFIMVVCATLFVLWAMVAFLGTRMTSVAVNVPPTAYTPTFGITGTMLACLGLFLVFHRIAKSK